MNIIQEHIKKDVETGNLKHIQFLVNVLEVNPHMDCEYALRLACQQGKLIIVKFLVEEQGSDIHVLFDAPIERALYFGHVDVVKYLLTKGARIHSYTTISQNKKFKKAVKTIKNLEKVTLH